MENKIIRKNGEMLATDMNSPRVPDTPVTPELPPINPALQINLPSFKYFTQVVQPLVFDDSLSLYEVTQKISASLNANIQQINALTGGVKDFMESMVKWGQEINAQWVAYQEALNKEWTDFQGEMNESYNNLVNQWNAYQADLNSQWSAYKTQVNAEMAALQGEWSAYKAGMEDDWSQFQLHYEQLWEQYKESIDSTIESQVNTWLDANANTTITNWLTQQNIPGWQNITTNRVTAINNFTPNGIKIGFDKSDSLDLMVIYIYIQGILLDTTKSVIITTDIDWENTNSIYIGDVVLFEQNNTTLIEFRQISMRSVGGKAQFAFAAASHTNNTSARCTISTTMRMREFNIYS